MGFVRSSVIGLSLFQRGESIEGGTVLQHLYLFPKTLFE